VSEKIEPNCLAVTVGYPPLPEIPAGFLVRVRGAFSALGVQNFLLMKAAHCQQCAQWCFTYHQAFGTGDHWLCEFDGERPLTYTNDAVVLPEKLLRRLPPPDIERLITSKDASVPA